MSGSDQIMLDSPAQTPEAKTQQQSVPQVGSSSSALPPPPASEIAMMIEDESTGMNNQDFSCGAAGSWNTKQWRDEYAIVTNKLLHKNFKPGEICPWPLRGGGPSVGGWYVTVWN